MFENYKEIFFGLAFGLAAALMDTGMDALADGNSLLDEVVEHPGMLLYRAAFVVLGLALGWLLWQRNRREREVRQVTELLRNFKQETLAQAMMLNSTLQTLLTRDELHLSEEASSLLRQAYQRAKDFQRLAEQNLPSLGS